MSDPYAAIKQHFADREGVTVNAGRGSQGLKLGKKMFAMFYKGDLLIRLVPERVSELIASGQGSPYDPGTGAPMKDRVLVPAANNEDWIALCEEALEYARSLRR